MAAPFLAAGALPSVHCFGDWNVGIDGIDFARLPMILAQFGR
jgi:hypothetical protein